MSYAIILIPIVVAVTVQVIKALVDFFKGDFSFASLYSYGGMPSGHAAFMTSAVVAIYWYAGPASPVFALSIIFTILVIRDALALRQQISEHSKTLNKLIKELPDKREYTYPVLQERVGHSILQVSAGIATGLVLTLILVRFAFI